MSVLLYVHSKYNDLPFFFLLPYPKLQHPLSPQSLCLTSRFLNCMHNDVTSQRLSWATGLNNQVYTTKAGSFSPLF